MRLAGVRVAVDVADDILAAVGLADARWVAVRLVAVRFADLHRAAWGAGRPAACLALTSLSPIAAHSSLDVAFFRSGSNSVAASFTSWLMPPISRSFRRVSLARLCSIWARP